MTVANPRRAATDLRLIPTDQIVYNDYNPNTQDDFTFSREMDSIRAYGFIDPPAVISCDDGSVLVIDGEHRVEAAKRLGYTELPCLVIGTEQEIGPTRRRALTILLNELRGQPDSVKLARVVEDIFLYREPDEVVIFPYADGVIQDYRALAQLGPTLPPAPLPHDDPAPSRTAAQDEPWERWNISLPVSAAEQLRETLTRIRKQEGFDEDYEALLHLAMSYGDDA